MLHVILCVERYKHFGTSPCLYLNVVKSYKQNTIHMDLMTSSSSYDLIFSFTFFMSYSLMQKFHLGHQKNNDSERVKYI